MARAGLFKSDVKKARDVLRAQGRHPSLDAVRIALGNTGSKSTIHRYLKELELEEGGEDGQRPALSETLQDLVQHLASQLQNEADQQIATVRLECDAIKQELTALLDVQRNDNQSLKGQLEQLETRLEQEFSARNELQERLQKESVAHRLAQQHVEELSNRLAQNEQHRVSLEEKHQHAREALEHYRASVKEQRDQDARRHEQQVQQLQSEIRTLQQTLIVKQDDLTRLNSEGVRLVADISHAQKDLRERAAELRKANEKLQDMSALEERVKGLQSELSRQTASSDQLTLQINEINSENRHLQIDLATARATIAAQETIVKDLRHYIVTLERPVQSMNR